MKLFSLTHFAFLAVLAAFTVLMCFVIKKLNRAWQNAVFIIVTVFAMLGIFFRHAMGLTIEGSIDWKTLALQMMQVCNFNFILLPLMLIPKNELARQYSCMFSMFAASTTFLSFPARFALLEWHHVSILNFWWNHYLAVLLPVLMIAARRLKPQKKYVLPIAGCVLAYFLAAFLIQLPLIKSGVLTAQTSLSYIFKTDKIPVFEILFKLIPVPFVYLLPMLPLFVGFAYLWARVFKNYKTAEYSLADKGE